MLFQRLERQKKNQKLLMNNSKLFIEKLYTEGAEMVVYTDSKTKPDKKYITVRKNGKWMCNCIANRMGNECSHIKIIVKETNEDKKCFYCGITFWSAGGLEQHHLYRRSVYPELKRNLKNIVWLCFKCHKRATENKEFEENLQKIQEIKNR